MSPAYYLVTERMLRADSRVSRRDLPLRGPSDALAIRMALDTGRLRPRANVRAWVEQSPGPYGAALKERDAAEARRLVVDVFEDAKTSVAIMRTHPAPDYPAPF